MLTNDRIERWRKAAAEATRTADGARALLSQSSEHDAAIDAGALVSIALALSVIAEVLVLTVADEAAR
jgi:hypothetical protein